jgi:predicted Zn-dependent protease
VSRPFRMLPPLAARLAEGRPVMSQPQVTELTKRILSIASAPTVRVTVTHTASVITRLANGQVLSGDDGDTLTIRIGTSYDEDGIVTTVGTNQLDDTVLQAIVRQCEIIDRERIRGSEEILPRRPQVPDQLAPVHLWHDATVRAMQTTRSTVVPELLDTVARKQLRASGFLGLMARSEAYLTRNGIEVYSEETDSEVTVTARTPDGKRSGWGGQAARNWATLTPTASAEHASHIATLGGAVVAFEPGRRMAILSATAVAQLMRHLHRGISAEAVFNGESPFTRGPGKTKIGLQVFDPRITMCSDPADPDGGYRPYFERGYGTSARTWVEQGVLKNLSYGVILAMFRGKAYVEAPYSLRVFGGPTSVAQMIAQCKEGIYVNQFSSVEIVNSRSGLMTGVTRDGCFLVKDGKIDRPIKNFRFLESPYFILNKLEALGPTGRVALGYTPPKHEWEQFSAWPRRPMIVPPMMVRDFNFNALADVV